jgi:hypothetical protein
MPAGGAKHDGRRQQQQQPPQQQQHAASDSSGGDGRARLLEKEVERLRLLVPTPAQRQPKLIILDLNGLLLYRRMAKDAASGPQPPRPFDKRAGAFQVWLRPHAVSFLDFLLSRFHVAIWSSAQIQNILPLLKLLRPHDGDAQLAFVWSQQECTDTGESHPENVHRPLFCKETAKVFEDPQHAGLFTPSRTLLIDDDAYKAERNLPNTCISPLPYAGETEEEDCQPGGAQRGGLGPKAELRHWLGRLALAESVPDFVAQHPWPPTRSAEAAAAAGTSSRDDSDPVTAVAGFAGGGGAENGEHAGQAAAAAAVGGGGGGERRERGKKGKSRRRRGNRSETAIVEQPQHGAASGDSSDAAAATAAAVERAEKEMVALVSGLQAQNDVQFGAAIDPAPQPEPAVSAPGVSVSGMVVTSSDERLEVTNALRSAALAGDIEGLQLAVSVAQHLGLDSEARMGQEKLARMLQR